MSKQTAKLYQFPSNKAVNTSQPRKVLSKSTIRAKKTAQLPKYVVVIGSDWYVRRTFASTKRDNKGRIIYTQVKRKCDENTAECAELLSQAIEEAWTAPVPEPKESLTDFLTHYLKSKKTSVSRRTYERLEADLERHLTGTTLAGMPLDKITPLDIQAHINSLTSAPSSIKKYFKSLKAVFNQAMNWDVIGKSPCRGIVVPRHTKKDIRFFDQNQAKAFLKECYKTNEYIIFEFALETGVRPGELCSLTWPDIDLKKCTVNISKSVTFGLKGGGSETNDPKTKKSKRTVEFGQHLRDRLLIHKQLQDEHKKELQRRVRAPLLMKHMKRKGENYNKRKAARRAHREALKNFKINNLVFPSMVGKPQSPNNLNRRQFYEVIDAIGLGGQGFSLYSLRHSYATLTLAAGAKIKSVSENLGHENIELTLDFYAHVVPSQREETANLLADLLHDQ